MSTGRPLDPSVRATRSDTQLIQNINRSIRSDWGGKEPTEVIMAKVMADHMLYGVCGPFGSDVNHRFALFIANLVCEQVEGIRKRTSHDREELLRRAREQEKTATGCAPKVDGTKLVEHQKLVARITGLENRVCELENCAKRG